jgi:hypothetical protein
VADTLRQQQDVGGLNKSKCDSRCLSLAAFECRTAPCDARLGSRRYDDRPQTSRPRPLDYFVRVVILVNVEIDVAIDYRTLTGNAVGFSGMIEAITANFRYSPRSFTSAWQ